VVPFLRLFRCFLSLLLWAAFVAGAEEAPPQARITPDDIRFTRTGDGFRVEATIVAPVPLDIAWQVLTDFEHMARFIPNLERSSVVSRKGNSLLVDQQGKIHFGPFSMVFGSTRDVVLQPMREIRARQITGTARSMDSTMRLQPIAEGTLLEYRADVVPDSYLPPMFGPGAVRREMADQFAAILSEMRTRAMTASR
jgi:carbon monoxide dehydrogenase subunit G